MAKQERKAAKQKTAIHAQVRPIIPVDQNTFLAGIKKIALTHVKGYVCLF
jgi:hypothetical protein